MTEAELFAKWSPAELRAVLTRALLECCDQCRDLLRIQLVAEEEAP